TPGATRSTTGVLRTSTIRFTHRALPSVLSRRCTLKATRSLPVARLSAPSTTKKPFVASSPNWTAAPLSHSTAWLIASTSSFAAREPLCSKTPSKERNNVQGIQQAHIPEGNRFPDSGSIRTHRAGSQAGRLRHFREELHQRAGHPRNQG